MSDIRLEDGTIQLNGEWLTAEELKKRIQDKMDSGEMKFAELASALEMLNKALEDAHTLEVRLVLPNAEYDKLRALGGDDDTASVRKAILAFVGGAKPKADPKPAAKAAPKPEPKPAAKPAPKPQPAEPLKPTQEIPPEEAAKAAEPAKPPPKTGKTIACNKCQTPIPIPSDQRPLELECEFCGTSVILPAEKEPNAESKPAAEGKTEPKRTDHFIG